MTWVILLIGLLMIYANCRPYSISGMRLAWRLEARRTKVSPDGIPAIAFGLRIGYWPCKRAPYVQVAVLFWRLDVWHGLPSARQIARGE